MPIDEVWPRNIQDVPRGVHVKGLDVLLTRIPTALNTMAERGSEPLPGCWSPASPSGDVLTSRPMPGSQRISLTGDAQLPKPMPRLVHAPKRDTRSRPNRCPDSYMLPNGIHAVVQTDAQTRTCSQAGCTQSSKPMPRLVHAPKRDARSRPNRCPDSYMLPSGIHAVVRTDTQIATGPQAGDSRFSGPSTLTKRSAHFFSQTNCWAGIKRLG